MNEELREKLRAIYADVDEVVRQAGPRCDVSGRCCHFTEYGHSLFISHFEAELLLESAPPYPQPVGPEGCPFQVGGLCSVRDSRPLACRIFFCDPAYEQRMYEITEDTIRRLKSLADEYGTGWRYAPLHHFLNTGRAGQRTPPTPGDSMTATVTRIPLPVLIPGSGGGRSSGGG